MADSTAKKKARTIKRLSHPGQYVHTPVVCDEDFLKHFIQSDEFQDQTIRKILPRRHGRPKGYSKQEAATQLYEEIKSGEIPLANVLVPWVNQPRKWLSFKYGKIENYDPSKFRPATELLQGFDADAGAWYGPVADGDRIWFIRAVRVKHWIPGSEESTAQWRPIRWHIFAEVTREYIALHWDGFSRVTSDKKLIATRFDYWKYIPGAWKQLESLLDGSWEHPNLKLLVLDKLWKRYVDVDGFNWRHERVNGAARGISLSARASSGRRKKKGGARKQMQDLTGFSRQMARNILASADIKTPSEEQLKRAENAGTYTMIHQWSPRSFEFSLKKKPEAGFDLTKDDYLCRAHCFFGAGLDAVEEEEEAKENAAATPPVRDLSAPDEPKDTKAVDAEEEDAEDAEDEDVIHDPRATEFSVQHIESYQTFGYSRRTLEFLLRELKRED